MILNATIEVLKEPHLLAASLIVSDQNHIPGPKPAVMNNDTTPGPVSFTIDIQGLDAQVSFLCCLLP